jgi:hypothetical protein
MLPTSALPRSPGREQEPQGEVVGNSAESSAFKRPA